jgi:serine/threonine-protein kinase
MADDPCVEELLEQLLDGHATPEEVCATCPDLLPVVRNRWRQMRRLHADLDALFPPSGEPTLHPSEETALPQVPGYEVEAVLGRGGMGVVYQARHLRLNRPVALKMMLGGAYAGPQERARFQREAEAVAGLRHENIVRVYDVGEHDGRPYFTMEFVEGGSLANKLQGAPQPARPAAALVATLAEAVRVAHEGGVVHRDLKPGNILLTADGTAKVSDFGLARLQGGTALTQSGVVMGTPSYMAPEQARGQAHAIGPAVDVYALGAILYELLTGRPPFRGETAAETVLQVIFQDPVPPSRLNFRVPRDLETISLKCLQKAPQQRYATAAALADDLRRFGEGRPIQARPLGWAARSWRWARRNPMAAALLTTALVLVGLASGGGVWFAQQRIQHDRELRTDVTTAVTQAVNLRQGFHFREARTLLDQAQQRLGPAGPDELRGLMEQAQADLRLVERLDEARSYPGRLTDKERDLARSDALYVATFEEAGLGGVADDPQVVASRVRASDRRVEIIAALDDWSAHTEDPERRKWVLEVARAADPNPTRDRLRQTELWKDEALFAQVIRELSTDELTPALAVTLSMISSLQDQESAAAALPLLRRAWRRFPQDFWLNVRIGQVCVQARRFDEALGFFQVALSMRPDAALPHHLLYYVHLNRGELDEAIEQSRESLRILPDSPAEQVNFAWLMLGKGQVDEAIEHLQLAVGLDPKLARPHFVLAYAFLDKGQQDEALVHVRQALALEPLSAVCLGQCALILRRMGRTDEALKYFPEAIRLDPKDGAVHHSFGLALSDKGRKEEAQVQFREAVKLLPDSATCHHDLGLALREGGWWEEAIVHFQKYVELDPKVPSRRTFVCNTSFRAAREFVKAAAGTGARPVQFGERDGAALRRQALQWLRSSLEVTVSLRKDAPTLALPFSVWQTDPDLASVRDPAALARLPAEEREAWQQLWMEVAVQISADPLDQGRIEAARGHWDRAAAGYTRAFTRTPTDEGHFLFEHAALLLLSGDRQGYAKVCAHMAELRGNGKGPRAYHVARACTLAPDSVADQSLPGRLAENELKSLAKQFWSLTEQGALAYRAGRYQDAVPLFEQSLKADAMPGRAVVNWLWLALAHQRLGKGEEARRWLGKAQAWLDQYRDGMPAGAEQELGLHFHNWLEAHVLRREAEALLAQH